MTTTKQMLENHVKDVAENEIFEAYYGNDDENQDDSAYLDWLNGILDVMYYIGQEPGDYRGVRIAVALGGPNIYVDTLDGEVVGYWGSDTFRWPLRNEAIALIDKDFEEQWNCAR